MLRDLIRLSVAVTPQNTPDKVVAKSLQVTPDKPDLNECSPDNLNVLANFADRAFRDGDRATAEAMVNRLYLEYDRRAKIAEQRRAERNLEEV